MLADNAYTLLGLGAFLEGELSVALGGALAQQGRLALVAVLAVAASVAWASDLACFWMGRVNAATVLRRLPSLQRRMGRLHRLVERYPSAVVLMVRFTYGMRVAGPLFLGTSAIGALRFAALSALAASAWAVLVVSVGWCLGSTAQQLVARHGWQVLLALPLAAMTMGALLFAVARRRGLRRG
jgi:membrane protein DedA with SNARE-associated domain